MSYEHSELHNMDATDQAELVRRGEISSVVLVTHHLERIDAYSTHVGAFLTVTADRALQAAQQVDAQPSNVSPSFNGVPNVLKALSPTAGLTTTRGSVSIRHHVPDVTAHVARLIEDAGVISMGKTNAPGFGLSVYTDNDLIGPARIPWDT